MRSFVALSFFAVVAGANAYSVFDFEELAHSATGGGGSTGAYTAISETDAGITMSTRRSTGNRFDIFLNPSILAGSFPLQWDQKSLSPFFASSANDWFISDFSVAFNAVELEATDFSADSDTVTMEVWSGAGATGALLATVTNFWGLQSSPSYAAVGWSSTTASGLSIKYRGGSTNFPQSMFIDNVAVRAVPEPATMAALGIGALALLRRRRK